MAEQSRAEQSRAERARQWGAVLAGGAAMCAQGGLCASRVVQVRSAAGWPGEGPLAAALTAARQPGASETVLALALLAAGDAIGDASGRVSAVPAPALAPAARRYVCIPSRAFREAKAAGDAAFRAGNFASSYAAYGEALAASSARAASPSPSPLPLVVSDEAVAVVHANRSAAYLAAGTHHAARAWRDARRAVALTCGRWAKAHFRCGRALEAADRLEPAAAAYARAARLARGPADAGESARRLRGVTERLDRWALAALLGAAIEAAELDGTIPHAQLCATASRPPLGGAVVVVVVPDDDDGPEDAEVHRAALADGLARHLAPYFDGDLREGLARMQELVADAARGQADPATLLSLRCAGYVGADAPDHALRDARFLVDTYPEWAEAWLRLGNALFLRAQVLADKATAAEAAGAFRRGLQCADAATEEEEEEEEEDDASDEEGALASMKDDRVSSLLVDGLRRAGERLTPDQGRAQVAAAAAEVAAQRPGFCADGVSEVDWAVVAGVPRVPVASPMRRRAFRMVYEDGAPVPRAFKHAMHLTRVVYTQAGAGRDLRPQAWCEVLGGGDGDGLRWTQTAATATVRVPAHRLAAAGVVRADQLQVILAPRFLRVVARPGRGRAEAVLAEGDLKHAIDVEASRWALVDDVHGGATFRDQGGDSDDVGSDDDGAGSDGYAESHVSPQAPPPPRHLDLHLVKVNTLLYAESHQHSHSYWTALMVGHEAMRWDDMERNYSDLPEDMLREQHALDAAAARRKDAQLEEYNATREAREASRSARELKDAEDKQRRKEARRTARAQAKRAQGGRGKAAAAEAEAEAEAPDVQPAVLEDRAHIPSEAGVTLDGIPLSADPHTSYKDMHAQIRRGLRRQLELRQEALDAGATGRDNDGVMKHP